MENTFNNLKINPALVKGLEKQNIQIPTEIQDKVIPVALENKDLIGRSQTGSGKTLAYLLPIYEKVDAGKRENQAIILTPTAELAVQVENQIKLLSKNSEIPVSSSTIIGKVKIKRQIETLKKEKPNIIVGTTGRIFELIKAKKIKAHTVKTIVIDEADRMVDKNNLNDVKNIIKTTQKDRQLMMFSASITERTKEIGNDLMKEPVIIEAKQQRVSSTINHLYITCPQQRDKNETLRKLITALQPERAIVFLNKSELIEATTNKLQHHDIEAFNISGSATKEERQLALQHFRNGKINILVSSDLSARGLDIEGLTHIINLDLPQDPNVYLHRVGRTGRKGQEGTAISIIAEHERNWLQNYEQKLKIDINEKVLYRAELQDPETK
ncbi:DEAD/DEAH box helicase [Haloplasma contractile]|uniref:ATP-dependent RNA helicase DEAD-DEAH box family protein n=1 Tax=Haloplasma contractile SSD-17B TaxID=1033810 RepID=F7Q0X6_9MOLU|nr:DEAD/DEAH box helicase [Haloplasma contractile]ERJ11355.1 ATP-dependent RNA helicase DEAD-DEAH box family protein [Haloplasma contractile SSD-17B]